MHSQALNLSIGYDGVEEMIATNDKLPCTVKQQAEQLELLQKMDEELPGHTQGSLECNGGRGREAPQSAGLQAITGPKRAPSPSVSFNIQQLPPKAK
jgi:hypothetical protein